MLLNLFSRMRGYGTVRTRVPDPARRRSLEVRLRLQVGRDELRLDQGQDALGPGGGELRQCKSMPLVRLGLTLFLLLVARHNK